jgi:hypothetical protein
LSPPHQSGFEHFLSFLNDEINELSDNPTDICSAGTIIHNTIKVLNVDESIFILACYIS